MLAALRGMSQGLPPCNHLHGGTTYLEVPALRRMSFARRWVDDLCYQLTFFCERLQQVKSLSQAHITTASPLTAPCSDSTLLLP